MSEATIERVELGHGYSIPRVVTGTWQLSAGHAVEPIARDAALRNCAMLVERGFTAFDTADIYGGAEELLGEFLRSLPVSRRQRVQIHTKFVPDRDALAAVDHDYVETIVDRSLRRLGVERLDLVQFAWWDYRVPGYVEAAGHLAELQRAGKIRLLGATNFDTPRLTEIIDAGIELACNQVQYSLLDGRPGDAMTALCRDRGLSLLCYGALAGGFLTTAWLGRPGPPETPANRSLTKYALIIDEFGGWDLYQEVLAAAASVAAKHDTSVAAVALAWVLDRPSVAAAIAGVSRSDRSVETARAAGLRLDTDDRRSIENVLARRQGPRGEPFELERDAAGKHAAIMRYNLNRDREANG